MPGLRLLILLALLSTLSISATAQQQQEDSLTFEYFPFAMYDTDVGVGAGVKTVLRHGLGLRESFDLLLFASSKGERLVRLGISWPDAELRQGSVYDIALDLLFDYDKMIHSTYYGIGPDARFDDREVYTSEPILLRAGLSRGFTPEMVGTVQAKFERIWSYGFASDSRLRDAARNATTSDQFSLMVQWRHDTRNSVLHTTRGMVVQLEVEQALDVGAHAGKWTRVGAVAQYYTTLASTVLAGRVILQHMEGNDIPVQQLLSIGGNSTVRGLPDNRYLDQSSLVLNAEWRVPLWWKFGAILGVDAGAVESGADRLPTARWNVTPVAGLRLAFETFVVRGDVGWSPDAVGVYLNFGQVF